jgi:outer membrane protein assembly factor BamB
VTRRLLLPVLGLCALLAACDSDKDIAPPATLVAFAARLDVEKVWSLGLGGKDRRLRLALAPAVLGDRLYAAGSDGDVFGVDARTGRVLWRSRTRLPLSAGPGASEAVVAVGASDGQLIALDAETGTKRWQARLSGEVLAAPVVTVQSVIVRTVDGRVRALALKDGHDLWTNEEAVPRLSLRGTAPPVVAGDAVLCGFDDGKVIAYAIAGGEILWQTAVSAPRGKTELERLVDVDGAVRVSGRDVFAVGFQGRLAMLALDTGQVWWARDLSSYRGLALADEALYVTTAESEIHAFRRRDGSPQWHSEQLARRGLTAPILDGDALVVADFQGYVHWLDRTNGTLLGRIGTRKDRVTNPPVAEGGIVYLQTDDGHLFALRAHPRAGAVPAPAPTPAAKPAAATPPVDPSGPH